MGMDVYGKNKTSEVGRYFRNNVWWWRPLWCYCEEIAPELTNKVKYRQSNDGDGLDAADSVMLGNKLLKEISSGRTESYSHKRKEKLSRLGKENTDTWYHFSTENVENFAKFLLECGGFEIW